LAIDKKSPRIRNTALIPLVLSRNRQACNHFSWLSSSSSSVHRLHYYRRPRSPLLMFPMITNTSHQFPKSRYIIGYCPLRNCFWWIGAGAGGASTAYHLAQLAEEYCKNVSITIFERSEYIGGRSTTINVFDDPRYPVELGTAQVAYF
jgi:hypothetical protein